jgi:hypothetical protein
MHIAPAVPSGGCRKLEVVACLPLDHPQLPPSAPRMNDHTES